MQKFRHHKIKRKHHVLEAIEPGLAALASDERVQGIIPGPIKPKAGGHTGFTFQYETPAGFKLIGRSSGAAQEVFVVTSYPKEVVANLERQGILPRLDRPNP